MACVGCSIEKTDDMKSSESEDCIDAALETIRKHYLALKRAFGEKERHLQLLQERNEKMVKALALLQRQTQNFGLVDASQELPGKRSRTNLDTFSYTCSAVNISNASSNDESSVLNLAQNGTTLINTSNTSSPSRNESIAETEKIRSPRVLRTLSDFPKRPKNDFPVRRLNVNDENQSPLRGFQPICCKNDGRRDPSIRKEYPTRSGDTLQKIPSDAKKMASLSLNQRRLKQTRLHTVAPNDYHPNEKKSKKFEVIEASPQAKEPTSSKLPRSRQLSLSSTFGDNGCDALPTKYADDLNEETVFNLSTTFRSCSSEEEDLPRNERKTALGCETLPTFHSSDHMESPSVVLLTPAAPEVVFLDDTCELMNMKSMDLLEDLVRGDNSPSTKLKCMENERINQLKNRANKLIKNESFVSSKPVTTKAEEHLGIPKVKIEKTSQNPPKMRTEKLSQHYSKLKIEKNSLHPLYKEDETFMDDTAKACSSPDLETFKKPYSGQKRSLKERFNINCFDCQMYIDFLGNQLSDREIENHLRNCTRHSRQEAMRPPTPDGFWNPFLDSFAEDDPRNEVLIDSRFTKRKR